MARDFYPMATLKIRPAAQATRMALWCMLAICSIAGLGGCNYLNKVSRPEKQPVAIDELSEDQKQLLFDAHVAKEAGDYGTALGLFSDILSENPTITTAYLGVGDILMAQKNYDEAEPAFRRASRLEPRNFEAQFGHGMSLHMLERYQDAVRAFHRSLTIEPDNIKANTSIATSYLQLNLTRSALAFAERAIELDPDHGAARSNLGAIYELLGRNEEAIEQYLAAMELLPPSPPLMLNLVNVLAKDKRYREVVNAAQTLLKIDASANALERMGYAYFRLGDFVESVNAYRRAVEINPNHWQSLNGLGVNALNRWLLSEKSDRDAATEARNSFRRSVQINPDQQRVVALLSNYNL